MHFMFSGEGPTDMGKCFPAADVCTGANYVPGEMAHIVDKLTNNWLIQNRQYELSHLDFHMVTFVSKSHLVNSKPPAKSKKSMGLRGKGTPPETKYYYANARALAQLAKQKAAELNDDVVAVLFRDADGTASAGRGMWKDKWDSMVLGFTAENYEDKSVPMIPMPKSEAWLLCALKNNYQNCNALEQASGNDKVENSLKKQLEIVIDDQDITDPLVDLIKDDRIDASKINMDSFDHFKAHLHKVLANVL
ncbi:hypothetical protein [Vibrio rarus]|uniref:hypothetical protein n=1 Tax=Vibrio rarus TaxID=413403 RepID=UPI0021C46C03|nr:hypothetical protein [Vibrio rarus]